MQEMDRRRFLKLMGLSALSSGLPLGSLHAAQAGRARFEPPDGRVYHGVGQTIDRDAVAEYLAALDTPAIEPLIEKRWVTIPGTRGLDLARVETQLNEVRDAGRVVELSIAFKDRSGATDVAIAETSRFDRLIDGLADVVRRFDQPLFVRPGFEFNGPWNGYTPVAYVAAFRKIVDRFRAAGIENAAFIWCYEPDAPNDFDAVENGQALWYPGDDVVDWFGHDVFQAEHFNPALPEVQRGLITKRGKTERFLAMARQRGKPVFLSETSAWFMDITPTASDPNLTDGQRDWEAWFRIFFDWISSHPEIKAFCYLNEDWTLYPDPDAARRGNAHIEINAFILERYREELLQPRYIHKPEGLFP